MFWGQILVPKLRECGTSLIKRSGTSRCLLRPVWKTSSRPSGIDAFGMTHWQHTLIQPHVLVGQNLERWLITNYTVATYNWQHLNNTNPDNMNMRVSVHLCPSISLSVSFCIYPSHLSTYCLSISPPLCLCISISLSLPFCLAACLPTCLPIGMGVEKRWFFLIT